MYIRRFHHSPRGLWLILVLTFCSVIISFNESASIQVAVLELSKVAKQTVGHEFNLPQAKLISTTSQKIDSRLVQYVVDFNSPTDSLFVVSCEIEDFAKMIRDTSSEEPSPRTMKLWFEPETERLVLAEITGGESHGAERTEEHEKALADSLLLSVESVVLPDSDYVSLFEALETCRWRPESASRVSARLFAYYSNKDKTAKPVWVISLIGIPPVMPHFRGGEDVPISRRDHMAVWIDAVTGELLSAGNNRR